MLPQIKLEITNLFELSYDGESDSDLFVKFEEEIVSQVKYDSEIQKTLSYFSIFTSNQNFNTSYTTSVSQHNDNNRPFNRLSYGMPDYLLFNLIILREVVRIN